MAHMLLIDYVVVLVEEIGAGGGSNRSERGEIGRTRSSRRLPGVVAGGGVGLEGPMFVWAFCSR